MGLRYRPSGRRRSYSWLIHDALIRASDPPKLLWRVSVRANERAAHSIDASEPNRLTADITPATPTIRLKDIRRTSHQATMYVALRGSQTRGPETRGRGLGRPASGSPHACSCGLAPTAFAGQKDGGTVGSHGLQRPRRVAANRIDIPNQPLVLLLA
jgi:hypothetical protein